MVIFLGAINSISWSTSLLYARMVAVERPLALRSLTNCWRAAWSLSVSGLIMSGAEVSYNNNQEDRCQQAENGF